MVFEDILYEKRDGIATITINRPQVLNAFRAETVEEMLQAMRDAGQAPSSRVGISSARARPKPVYRFSTVSGFTGPRLRGIGDRLNSRRGKVHADIQGLFPGPGRRGCRQPVLRRRG